MKVLRRSPRQEFFSGQLEQWVKTNRPKGIVTVFLPECQSASSRAISGTNISRAALRLGIPLITIGLTSVVSGNSDIPLVINLCFEKQDIEVNLQGIWQQEQGEQGHKNPNILLSWPGLGSLNWQGSQIGQREALRQAFILGVGGMRALQNFGIFQEISHFYLDGEIAALAMVEVLRIENGKLDKIDQPGLELIRQKFSIRERDRKAGFSAELVERVLTELSFREAVFSFGLDRSSAKVNFGKLCERLLGMGEKTKKMSGIALKMNSIVHAAWTAPALAGLLDKYFPYWKEYPGVLSKLPLFVDDLNFRQEIWNVHQTNKQELFGLVPRSDFDQYVITVGFGGEKSSLVWGQLITRADFKSQLLNFAKRFGGLQIVFYHGADFYQREETRRIKLMGKQLERNSGARIKFIEIEARKENVRTVLAGVDLWLDSPNGGEGSPSVRGMIAMSNGVINVVPHRKWLDPQAAASREILPAFLEKLQPLCSREAQIDEMIRLISDIAAHPETAGQVQTAYATRWRPDWEKFSGSKSQSTPGETSMMMGQIDRASSQMTSDPRISNVERMLAMSLIALGASRVTRYKVRNSHIRIERRWTKENESIKEEHRRELRESGFFNWRHISQFSQETMGQLFIEEGMQVIIDPRRYQGCYRDGELVTGRPFILVPEKIAGEICGVIKIDFNAPGELRGTEQERSFIRTLMHRAEQIKTSLLWHQLRNFLKNTTNEAELLDRLLIVLTSGGFLGVPQYTTMNNRCAIFLNDAEGVLRPLRAIGETNHQEFWAKLAKLGKDLKRQKVWRDLRQNPPHDFLESSLRESPSGLNSYIPPFAVEIKSGRAIRSEGNSGKKVDFDKLTVLMAGVEDLFQIRGQAESQRVKDYLLVPLRSGAGQEFGLIYIDNAFTLERPLVEKISTIARIAADRLSLIRQRGSAD